MKRIVMVALDGSEKDGRAVAAASAVSRLSESDLHFVRVIGQDVVATNEAGGAARLAKLADDMPPSADVVATTAGRQATDIAQGLIDYAVAHDVLLIVLATRAPGARSRAIAGSVADHVMRESPRPVILVPPGAAFTGGKETTISRVLVPFDDSSLSFRSIEFIAELPRAKELEYVLIEVVGDEHARATAQTRLDKTAAWLRSRGATKVETHALEASDVPTAILGTVRDALVDAILMSTRGAGGLSRLVLGSVAEQVVRRSELPVMLLTPRMLAAR